MYSVTSRWPCHACILCFLLVYICMVVLHVNVPSSNPLMGFYVVFVVNIFNNSTSYNPVSTQVLRNYLSLFKTAKKKNKKGKTISLTDFLAEDGGTGGGSTYVPKPVSWADETDDLEGDGNFYFPSCLEFSLSSK